MNQRKYLLDFYDVLINDETLVRLLANKPTNGLDDPLSTSKPNIIGSTNYWKIIKERLIRSPKSSDLSSTTTSLCRVCMYLGYTRGTSNIKIASQDIVFDVYVHMNDYDSVDVRSLWICDRISELLQDKKISGFGKVDNYQNYIIQNAPEGYIGYKMVFSFGSVK